MKNICSESKPFTSSQKKFNIMSVKEIKGRAVNLKEHYTHKMPFKEVELFTFQLMARKKFLLMGGKVINNLQTCDQLLVQILSRQW